VIRKLRSLRNNPQKRFLFIRKSPRWGANRCRNVIGCKLNRLTDCVSEKISLLLWSYRRAIVGKKKRVRHNTELII